ncbi:hypothetical protein BDR07DRAFT_1611054 [Suillus spraguei]|nr:hypothetical protein BDR07DRAFT_1611054 [Suillus spraguei]
MNIPTGIIKGSEHALTCPEGVLDRANYLCFPIVLTPNGCHPQTVTYELSWLSTTTKGPTARIREDHRDPPSSFVVCSDRTENTLRVEVLVFVPRSGHPKDRLEVIQHNEKEITKPQPQEFEGEEESEEDVRADTDAETHDALERSDEAVTSLAPDLADSQRSNRPSVVEERVTRNITERIPPLCWTSRVSSEWRSGYYNFLFLPYLLVCLERGIALTRAAKAKTRGLLNKESHEKFEELGRQRSKGSKLRKQLEPSSQTHHAHDRIDALKCGALEVKELMQDVQSEFQMTYKGIVLNKVPTQKKKERPILNVKDIDST